MCPIERFPEKQIINNLTAYTRALPMPVYKQNY